MLSKPANSFTLIQLHLSLGSRVYPNGQGSWARPGWGKSCSRASPSWLALRTHDLGFALAVCATRSWLGLCPDNNEMNSFITIKWIHRIFTLQKLMNSSAKSMKSSAKLMNSSAKSMNSSTKIYEFISSMNSLVNEFINFEKNIKNLLWDSNHVPNISTHSAASPTACWTLTFFTIYILLLHMILMSEKMMSQTITDEFIYVLFETT